MAKIINPTKVVTGKSTRFSYLIVNEPKAINGGTPKYSVSLIIPKSDTVTVEKIKAAIKAAYAERGVNSMKSGPSGDLSSENVSGGTPPPVRWSAERRSFPLPVTGTTRISTMPVPTATTGPRLSIRTIRTTRGTSTSIPTMLTGTTTTVTTGNQSALSQYLP